MNDLWNQPSRMMFDPQTPQAIAPPLDSIIAETPNSLNTVDSPRDIVENDIKQQILMVGGGDVELTGSFGEQMLTLGVVVLMAVLGGILIQICMYGL